MLYRCIISTCTCSYNCTYQSDISTCTCIIGLAMLCGQGLSSLVVTLWIIHYESVTTCISGLSKVIH